MARQDPVPSRNAFEAYRRSRPRPASDHSALLPPGARLLLLEPLICVPYRARKPPESGWLGAMLDSAAAPEPHPIFTCWHTSRLRLNQNLPGNTWSLLLGDLERRFRPECGGLDEQERPIRKMAGEVAPLMYAVGVGKVSPDAAAASHRAAQTRGPMRRPTEPANGASDWDSVMITDTPGVVVPSSRSPSPVQYAPCTLRLAGLPVR